MLFDFNGLYYLQHHRRYRTINMLSFVGAQVLVMLIVPLFGVEAVAKVLGDILVAALLSISITEVVLKKVPAYSPIDGVLGQTVLINQLKDISNYRPFKVK